MLFLWVILFISLAFAAIGFLVVYLDTYNSNDFIEGLNGAFWGAFIGVLITVPLFLLLLVAAANSQYSKVSEYKATTHSIQLYTARKEELQAVIKTELGKYPEYEQKILSNLDPKFILSFPELKANETITETVKQIVNLNNDIYDRKDNLIQIKKSMYHYHISPWTMHSWGPDTSKYIEDF